MYTALVYMILALLLLCIPVVVREELRWLGPLNNLQSWTESNPPNICGKGLLVQYILCEHDPKCSIYAASLISQQHIIFLTLQIEKLL